MRIFKLLLYMSLLLCSCGHEGKKKEKTTKKVAFIFSFMSNEIGYKHMYNLTVEQLRRQGIEPDIDLFFLDCEKKTEGEELEAMKEHLDKLEAWGADIIMVCKDQATYALLKCGHPLTHKLPIVFTSVNFPNDDLLEEHKNGQIYGLVDTPDIRKNIEFIQSILGEPPHVAMNFEVNFLGRKSYELLCSQVSVENIYMVKDKLNNYRSESTYNRVVPFLRQKGHGYFYSGRYYDDWLIELLPFRYWTAMALMVRFSTFESQNPLVFLLDKYDLMATSMCRLFVVPVFSCVRNGFGENINILGGYFATDETTAAAWAGRAATLLHGGVPGGDRYQELPKEYQLDYSQFRLNNSLELSRVPGNVHFINMPWYVRYRVSLFVLGSLLFAGVLLLVIAHFYMRRKVKEKDELLKHLESMHEQITLSTTGGDISLWSRIDGKIMLDNNFRTMSGLDHVEFSNEEFFQYVHPDDHQVRINAYETASHIAGQHGKEDSLSNKKIQITSFRYRLCFDGSGNYEWYGVNCCVTRDSHGKEILAGILQNVQQLVEYEEELIHAKELAEQAELKQSFLANMSHEIRTPLNAIVGFTNLLVDPENSEAFAVEEKREMINSINNNTNLLLKLIGDVLEISRLESGYTEMTVMDDDLVKIVKDIYNTHRLIIKDNLDFRLELDEDKPILVCLDKLRFIQVISNFLNNANKFTERGSITLGIESYEAQKEVAVYVEDTGCGISREHQMMIFDRFYKANEFAQGTGLGLSICKVIMDKMGGRIELQSEKGKGSRFSAILSLNK